MFGRRFHGSASESSSQRSLMALLPSSPYWQTTRHHGGGVSTPLRRVPKAVRVQKAPWATVDGKRWRPSQKCWHAWPSQQTTRRLIQVSLLLQINSGKPGPPHRQQATFPCGLQHPMLSVVWSRRETKRWPLSSQRLRLLVRQAEALEHHRSILPRWYRWRGKYDNSTICLPLERTRLASVI